MSTQESISLFNKFRQYTNALVDSTMNIESKLNSAQEISEHFESVISSLHYSAFLEYAIPKFLQALRDGEPEFNAESQLQEFRKLILEIIHRIPTNETLKPFVKPILSMMFHLLEIENEDNVLICLKIIIELHKQYRPQIQPEIQSFLQFVKNIYKELPNNAKLHFDVVTVTPAGYLPSEAGGVAQSSSRPTTPSGKSLPGGSPAGVLGEGKGTTSTSIPKASQSLKVLAELPIIVVLMYQLYKQNVHTVIGEFIPLVMSTITLQPSAAARRSPSFNKEVYVDFAAAQIKTLSFLAYMARYFLELVSQCSSNMVGGMLALFRYCPQEVALLRKELLVAARHILATDTRTKFVPYIEQLFDEEVLIGSGWTVNEGLRPLAYSTLADFVHHVRSLLSLPNLAPAVHLFSKNVHDESLPISIQRMSCKLLLNLVECIRQKSDESGTGREILMKMLEVFVRKFQTIAKYHIPAILEKCQTQSEGNGNSSSSLSTETSSDSDGELGGKSKLSQSKDAFSVPDYREMVKTLVCGVKTITWGAGSCKLPADVQIPVYPQGNKVFYPKETQIFIRLLKYALQALDVYQISLNPSGTGYVRMANSPQQVRMKEEKEILEHSAGVFTMLNTATFKEVFTATIEYLVERIHNNYALQIIPNSFLANPNTSATFATILVRFLLDRLEDMGTKSERSNLYLKLFKLVFGSVSLFAQENEQMLKPHLHEIVNRSMELAMQAKEPYNYFLLLRALFRSIGGGSHDLLYQEFLPLLPNLLQGLNNLQSGIHKQHMKDLFVELCLTVPVRLSSLLPYLPMLMDPLVSALNGSQTLISQGLRTLELCVDNLQPDFLYDHIQPVRADLMQALWRTLRSPHETIAHVAFRVLGKFGGGSRKMLREPQKLTYQQSQNVGSCICLFYRESKDPIDLPAACTIERAVNLLKSHPSNLQLLSQQTTGAFDNTPFYRQQAWNVVKYYLIAAVSLEDSALFLDELLLDIRSTQKPVMHANKSFATHCTDEESKKTLQHALTGMLFGAFNKDIRDDALWFANGILRHFALVAVVQQTGPYALQSQSSIKGMNVHTVIDAIADVMSHEDKDLCRTGEFAIYILFETACVVIGSMYKAAQLPFFEYMSEKLCSCCYERAWFAKNGGCLAIRYMVKIMPFQWTLEHQPTFITALMFVMMDLNNEVSSGTVALAKEILKELLVKCNTPSSNEGIAKIQSKVFPVVVQHMVREVVSPNHTVREQARSSLQVLSEITGKSVYEIMEPHKALLEDMIPPKKHLLRHQPVSTQVALMDGNTFCTSLSPRLFTMDLNITEHRIFFQELYTLCETDDSQLTKLPCYKSVQSFSQLRTSALAALTSCHYIVQAREKIFNVLVKAINSSTPEVMQAGKENMEKFIYGGALESVKDLVPVNIRPLLLMLGDYRSLTMNVLQKLTCFMELFPELFNEKLCEQLLAHLERWTEEAKKTAKNQNQQQMKPALRSTEEIKICAAIMNMFHVVPAASAKLIDQLVQLTVKTERALILEIGSPFREPLIKFLLRYPTQTADFFLANIADSLMNRLFVYMLNRKDSKLLRTAVESNPLKLVNSTFTVNIPPNQANDEKAVTRTKQELQFQGILIIRTLVKHNDVWLPQHPVLINHLRRIWTNESMFEKGKKAHENTNLQRWREPKLLAKCLINYIKHRPNEIDLLFQILRVFTTRTIPSFHFLKKFLEEDVIKGYSIEQKRQVFFTFVECFQDNQYPIELKAMALQHVIIPMFQTSFKNGETDMLIGGPPNPEKESNDNVVSVFISKVIDPENPFGTNDSVRILLLQLSALLVEHAGPHIHYAANKKQGNKLRRLYIFAWPCLLPKQCVDPATKYHGHYLQAHIIAKFAIHKKSVLQVFIGLLKAHAQEAKSIVRQALDVLTPVLPHRMEDGNAMLAHWTKKIIVEEGHTLGQLVHMLQLVVRHRDVYYPVRMDLMQHIVNSIQRLGFTASATIEHRRLAVDLVETVIEWETKRARDESESKDSIELSSARKQMPDDSYEPASKKPRSIAQSGRLSSTERAAMDPALLPIEKHHADAICNFLFRIACQVNDQSSTGNSSGEALSKRCFKLLKTALKPDCWPDAELRVSWLDKLFLMLDQTPNANFANVCVALDILAYLCTILHRQDILTLFKPLQRGIVGCMGCQNGKVVRAVHSMLVKLLDVYPIDPGPSSAKVEELDFLFNNIGSGIYEGLQNYERPNNSSTTILYGPLMLLKAACSSSPGYIDKFMLQFMKALQKMQKDHVAGQQTETGALTEMLVLSLELVKNRMVAMLGELRKVFLTILTTLIEKSPDAKLLKAMTKIVDEWMRAKQPAHQQNQVPSIREKSLLLYRMMINFEKRFSEDIELHTQFLEVVNYVYRDEGLKGSELTARLEPAFLAGLRSVQPQIRMKFMEVFNASVGDKLFERLRYIFATQSWEHMGSQFWIKQCLEFLLSICVKEKNIICSSVHSKLASITSVIRQSSDVKAKKLLVTAQKGYHTEEERHKLESSNREIADLMEVGDVTVKQEPVDPDDVQFEGDTTGHPHSVNKGTTEDRKLPDFFFLAQNAEDIIAKMEKEEEVKEPSEDVSVLGSLAQRHGTFLSKLRHSKCSSFLSALCQLCHRSTVLAHTIWIELFPALWGLLEEKHHTVLAGEMGPFLCSGGHLHQTDCYRSSINTLVEGMARCNPPIPIRPIVIKYLGKTHNLWHRATMLLESAAMACEDMLIVNPQLPSQQLWLDLGFNDEDVAELPVQETFNALAEMYSMIGEDDLWAGLWQKRCRRQETSTAIAYEQQGLFDQAQNMYESAMGKAREHYNAGRIEPKLIPEYQLWEDHWVRCAKELGQWDILMEFGKTKGQSNPFIMLESAWRIPDWQGMKEALAQVEMSYPESMAYRLTLYRGYFAICDPEEQHLNLVEKFVETSTTQAIRQWRKLPSIVSYLHTPLLRAAQQIMELQEASQIHLGLQPQSIGRVPSLHDMKAIVKTWRNRLPLHADDLAHWSDIFMWRHHHYQAIVAAYENLSSPLADAQPSHHAMLGVHASAWSIIYYGYVARKHGLTGVCLDSLSRIHTIPSVPIVDCFQKIRQQVKCYLQMAGVMGKQELQEGLEVIESTNLRYFSKEMTAEFFALKGMFLAQVGRSEEANKAFSEAVQMHDTLVKAWALWGDYLDNLLVSERNITIGVYAIICYMHACRSQNETKCRKYLARSLWLLTYDDEKGTLAENLEKYSVGVPPTHWLPWIPQLLTCLVRREGIRVLSLIFSVGRVFPQAVYFPIRTLYLTLKIEQREKYKKEQMIASANAENKGSIQSSTNSQEAKQKLESKSRGKPLTIQTGASGALSIASTDGSVTGSTTSTTGTTAPSSVSSSDSSTPSTTATTLSVTSSAAAATSTTSGSSNSTGGATLSASQSSSSETGMIRVPAHMLRCTKIMHMLRDLHPTLLSALEGFVDQMVWFRECWHEEVLRQLRQGLAKCYQVAFEHRGDVNTAQVTPRTLSFLKKLVSTFGIGFEAASSVSQSVSSAASESLARRAQATAQDPAFQKLKGQFTADFDFSQPGSMKLHTLISKLKDWIRILEAKAKLLPSSFLLEERCRFLSNFSQSTAEVELPGEFLMPKTTTHSAFYVRIAKFMPRVELVQRHNFSARRLTIRGHNGKLYPYLVVNDAWITESRREERVLQLLRMMNHFLEKRKETARRHLQFTVPRVVALSPQMRLIEDNASTISLSEIYKELCHKKNTDPDAPIALYYSRLGSLQARGFGTTHQVLRDILKEVQNTLVPDNMLKDWTLCTYPSASDYWTFRKMFSQQVALAGFIEFVLHLTRLGPETINIARDCGHVTFNFFKFDVDDTKGDLDANRPVPFRLTPNLCEFITPVGITGLVTHCMIAVGRCLVQPQFSIASYFKAILKDEMVSWHKKKQDETLLLLTSTGAPPEMENELLITMVTNAANAMMTRLQNLAHFENAESKVSTLIAAACSADNLCRMDPAWHPWL